MEDVRYKTEITEEDVRIHYDLKMAPGMAKRASGQFPYIIFSPKELARIVKIRNEVSNSFKFGGTAYEQVYAFHLMCYQMAQPHHAVRRYFYPLDVVLRDFMNYMTHKTAPAHSVRCFISIHLAMCHILVTKSRDRRWAHAATDAQAALGLLALFYSRHRTVFSMSEDVLNSFEGEASLNIGEEVPYECFSITFPKDFKLLGRPVVEAYVSFEPNNDMVFSQPLVETWNLGVPSFLGFEKRDAEFRPSEYAAQLQGLLRHCVHYIATFKREKEYVSMDELFPAEETDAKKPNPMKKDRVCNVTLLSSKPKTIYPQIEGEESVPRGSINCRYTVRGHERMQPCGPGKKFRRKVWIKEHVKGPEDKEIKPKKYHVK